MSSHFCLQYGTKVVGVSCNFISFFIVLFLFICCFHDISFNKRNEDDNHDQSECGHDDDDVDEEQKALLGSLRTPLHLLAYENAM